MTPVRYFGDTIYLILYVSVVSTYLPLFTPRHPPDPVPSHRAESIDLLPKSIDSLPVLPDASIAATSDHGTVAVVSHFTHPESVNV